MPIPKRVIVTGAARGIGHAIASHLLQTGCQVLVVDCNIERLATSIAELERGYPGRVASHCMDLADADAILQDFSNHPWCREGLDGLVNNAAVALHGPFAEFSLEQIEQTWRINMRAP